MKEEEAVATAKYYGTGRRKHSVARVYLVPGTGKITINKRWISWIRNIKSSCTSAISCNRYNWQIWCISKRSWWWIYRTGWSNPSWYFQSFITGWWRIPFNIKESWILNKRPKNERKKETRSSQSTSCTTVLKTLIIRYGRYEEYTEPFNGEIYWKAFSNDLVWKT